MKHFHAAKATDAQLLIQFEESRDQSAFAELVRRHGPMVFATARRVLRSEQDVEEAFQATMFALARSAGKLRQKAVVAGWLHRTAFRCAVDVHRSNVSWKRKADRMTARLADRDREAETTDPLLGVANEELERILDQELVSLSERLREVVVLCELEGLPQKQVAKQLGIPTSTVSDRLTKGRRLLHARLVRRGAMLTLSGVATAAQSSNTSASISEAFIRDISAKATLYAAGKSAAEIGVSSTVIQIATKVTIAMTKAKLITVVLTAIAIVPLVGALSQIVGVQSNTARGATIFIDEFDGSAVLPNGTPVMWTPFQNTQISIGAGELVVSGNGFPAAQVEGLGMENTSLRTEFLLRRGNSVAVYVRTTEQAGRKGYAASLSADGTAKIRFDGTGEELARKSTNIDPMGEFVAMQIDAIGDELKLWIWPAENPRPVAPLIEVTDESGFVGDIGIGAAGGGAEAVFRLAHLADAHIPDVPEPSTAALSTVSLMILVYRARRRRATVDRLLNGIDR